MKLGKLAAQRLDFSTWIRGANLGLTHRGQPSRVNPSYMSLLVVQTDKANCPSWQNINIYGFCYWTSKIYIVFAYHMLTSNHYRIIFYPKYIFLTKLEAHNQKYLYSVLSSSSSSPTDYESSFRSINSFHQVFNRLTVVNSTSLQDIKIAHLSIYSPPLR
jgi:hypothetical protein